jgi:hypothetical protein
MLLRMAGVKAVRTARSMRAPSNHVIGPLIDMKVVEKVEAHG